MKTPESFKLGNNYLFLHHYVPNILATALHAERTRLATLIQTCYRRYRQRNKYVAVLKEIQYAKEEKNTIKIQSIVRMRREKKVKAIALGAATKIQSLFRAKPVQNEFVALKKSALRIQTVARMLLAKKERARLLARLL